MSACEETEKDKERGVQLFTISVSCCVYVCGGGGLFITVFTYKYFSREFWMLLYAVL